MKNSMGEQFDVQRNTITFTQLGWKKLKCNDCGEKVTRNWVESHRNSHKNWNSWVVSHRSNIKKKVSWVMNLWRRR